MEPYKLARINDQNADLKKRWFVEYSFKNPDTDKFEPHRLWISFKLKSRAARYIEGKKIQDIINQKLRSGFDPHKATHHTKSLIDALAFIVEIKKITCGKRAEHTYGYIARKLSTWLIDNKYEDIKPVDFSKHLAILYFDYILLTERKTNRTYNNHLIGLRTLFNCLVERDYLEFNILTKLKKLPQKQADIITYTPEEKRQIAEHLDVVNQELFLAAQMIYYCFIR